MVTTLLQKHTTDMVSKAKVVPVQFALVTMAIRTALYHFCWTMLPLHIRAAHLWRIILSALSVSSELTEVRPNTAVLTSWTMHMLTETRERVQINDSLTKFYFIVNLDIMNYWI